MNTTIEAVEFRRGKRKLRQIKGMGVDTQLNLRIRQKGERDDEVRVWIRVLQQR